MKKALCFASLAVLIGTMPAFAAECLQVGRIDRWRPLDNKTVIARSTTHREYKVALNGICPNLKMNVTIALKANSNSGLDCVRRGDAIVVKAFNDAVTCSVASVEPYKPASPAAPEAPSNR